MQLPSFGHGFVVVRSRRPHRQLVGLLLIRLVQVISDLGAFLHYHFQLLFQIIGFFLQCRLLVLQLAALRLGVFGLAFRPLEFLSAFGKCLQEVVPLLVQLRTFPLLLLQRRFLICPKLCIGRVQGGGSVELQGSQGLADLLALRTLTSRLRHPVTDAFPVVYVATIQH
eukprot:Skav226272  [mRNA]  locus=scaffold1414:26098:47612:- [translate_table: standard]